MYDDSVNKVPPSLMFPPEDISLWCDFLSIYVYILTNTAVVFCHLQDIWFHLASHIVIYLKSSFLTLLMEFCCHSSIFRSCVTTLSQTLSFWFFSHYSILDRGNKDCILYWTLRIQFTARLQPPAPNQNLKKETPILQKQWNETFYVIYPPGKISHCNT